MVNQTNQFETGLDDDIALLTETLEEVLKASGDPADQKYIELKSKAEQALNDVKSRVSQASDSYYYRAKQAAYRADDYVHEKTVAGCRYRCNSRSGTWSAAGASLIAIR